MMQRDWICGLSAQALLSAVHLRDHCQASEQARRSATRGEGSTQVGALMNARYRNLLGGLALLGGLMPAAASQLVVEVTGLSDEGGPVVVEVYGSRVGFPRQPSYTLSVPVRSGMARAEFNELGPSDYAVHVWHDINENGKQDRRFGAEPFGYSNLPVGERGDWDEVRVSLGVDPLNLRFDFAPLRDE